MVIYISLSESLRNSLVLIYKYLIFFSSITSKDKPVTINMPTIANMAPVFSSFKSLLEYACTMIHSVIHKIIDSPIKIKFAIDLS